MFKIISPIVVVAMLFTSGCGNLSPRDNFSPKQEQKIDNQNGRIGELENLSNSIKAELLKLQQSSEITDSQLDKVQQGLANFQSINENSGIQILSGQGGLILSVMALLATFMMVLYYRKTSIQNGKAADILAETIVRKEDEELEEQVFVSALNSPVEKKVYKLMMKYKN